jgi:hypothetical protein
MVEKNVYMDIKFTKSAIFLPGSSICLSLRKPAVYRRFLKAGIFG